MKLLACFTILLWDACPAQTLHGAGATFPAPLYRKWIASFQKSHRESIIDYQETGSVAGAEQVLNGHADFAGSDVSLTDDQPERAPIGVLQIPTVIGAVAVVDNVQGQFRDLKFTPEVLAAIYLKKIRKWNDPAIASFNRGERLPPAEITVVHRSDQSGTTWIWTTFLSEASSEWKTGRCWDIHRLAGWNHCRKK
ncbi:MAG TPA: phosphate ABC transporter substrate-binding protein PstS [Bryobacteraceae bacterium]|jgi:phosphate transport system substrate-binding protein|nr:phosphate ABC transporter substrate-binding protein PstS [Bryobacteraceae bacterium]